MCISLERRKKSYLRESYTCKEKMTLFMLQHCTITTIVMDWTLKSDFQIDTTQNQFLLLKAKLKMGLIFFIKAKFFGIIFYLGLFNFAKHKKIINNMSKIWLKVQKSLVVLVQLAHDLISPPTFLPWKALHKVYFNFVHHDGYSVSYI